MSEKIGRNDPCPCGSGKKYKQCCISKKGSPTARRPLKATWLNQPAQPVQHVNLIERTFGSAIAAASDKPLQKNISEQNAPQISENQEKKSHS